MTNADKSEITERLIKKKKRQKLSSAAIARTLEISEAVVSNVINGKWGKHPISDAVWNRIASYIDYRAGWNTADTKGHKRVMNVCRHAQRASVSRAISDEAGAGKSEGLKHYQASNPGVYYLECWKLREKDFMIEASRTCGLNPTGTTNDMLKALIEFLNSQSAPLMIFDEFDKLTDGSMMLVKVLIDKAKSGFILAGATCLKEKLETGGTRNKVGYKELYSRVGGEFRDVGGIDLEDITLICELNGVTEEEVIKRIYYKSNNDLRRVKSLIENYLLKIDDSLSDAE